MNIGWCQLKGALFNLFVVKKWSFCIFRTLPSVSKIIPTRILIFRPNKSYCTLEYFVSLHLAENEFLLALYGYSIQE